MNKRAARNIAFYLLVAALHVGAAAGAAAFSFSPMQATIAPSGANAVMTYQVRNESEQQIAVSIKVMTRSMDIKGEEANAPVDSLFLVFPSRIVLKPNSVQNIKVQYRGPAAIASEQAFRVIAEQIPIDFTKSEASGVNILLTYVAALYVAPSNISSSLILQSATGVEKDGVPGLQVIIKNEGKRHALLNNPIIRITESTGANTVELSGEAMTALQGQNILALSARMVFVPWPAAEIGVAYRGSFSAETD